MKNRQFAVIGLGRFGTSLIKELTAIGYEVLAVDSDETKTNAAAGRQAAGILFPGSHTADGRLQHH